MICAHCSAAVPTGASFCPTCGARLLPSSPGRQPDTLQSKIRPRQIGYGCAGLVALFFIGIWLLGALSGKEIVDSLLRLLEILVSWPTLFLVMLIRIRHQLPELVSGLSERITKAPGGWEVLREVKEDVKVVRADIKTLEARVERIDERLIETHSLANLQRLNLSGSAASTARKLASASIKTIMRASSGRRRLSRAFKNSWSGTRCRSSNSGRRPCPVSAKIATAPTPLASPLGAFVRPEPSYAVTTACGRDPCLCLFDFIIIKSIVEGAITYRLGAWARTATQMISAAS